MCACVCANVQTDRRCLNIQLERTDRSDGKKKKEALPAKPVSLNTQTNRLVSDTKLKINPRKGLKLVCVCACVRARVFFFVTQAFFLKT